MGRISKSMAVVVAGALGLTACTTGTSASGTPAAGKAKGGKVRIVMLLNDQFDPYYLTLVKGASEEAKAKGVDFSWQAPSTLDVASQTQLLNSVAATKPDGIIMSALDANAMIAPMKQVQAQGVPVVTVDSDVNDKSARLTTFKSEGIKNGQLAADTMNQLLSGTGKVGYVGYTPGVESVDVRLKGWQQELKNFPGLTNEGEQYATADIADNASKAAALISRVPDLAGIYASWTNASIGASQAVQQAGKVGKVKVIGVDASPDEVDLLKRGLIDALVVQKPYSMGKDAVDALTDYAKNGKSSTPEHLYDFVLATKTNLDDPQVKQFLYVKPEGK